MKYWFPLFVFLICLSCNDDQSKNNNPTAPHTNVVAIPPDTIIDTDTAGCVLPDTRQDTLITNDNLHVHVIIETYCTHQTFWDTTLSVGGKGLTTQYKSYALYNYREMKIKFEIGNKVNEIRITNQTFKDSVNHEFYRKGMINAPDKIEFVPKDTSLKLEVDLFAPGDARMIINTSVNRKGKVKVLSTSYEGPY